MDNNNQTPQEQPKKQKYDYIRGYQFVKGQSGNPGGRPKGSKTLKTFAREYLERLPPEEKIKFLEALPEELVWKMAEGAPATKLEGSNENPLTIEIKNYGQINNPIPISTEKLSDEVVANATEIQDSSNAS